MDVDHDNMLSDQLPTGCPRGLLRLLLLGSYLGEGAAAHRGVVVRIRFIPCLRIAVTVFDQQPALRFTKAARPHERKRALEYVPLEAECQLVGSQTRLA